MAQLRAWTVARPGDGGGIMTMVIGDQVSGTRAALFFTNESAAVRFARTVPEGGWKVFEMELDQAQRWLQELQTQRIDDVYVDPAPESQSYQSCSVSQLLAIIEKQQ